MSNVENYKLNNKSKCENQYNLFRQYLVSSCLLVAMLVLICSASFYNILIGRLKNEVDNLTNSNNDLDFFKNYKNVQYDMPLFDTIQYGQMTYKRIQLYSSGRNWMYIMDFPRNKYIYNIYKQVYPFAFLVILVMVLGIIGAYLMSKRNYRPIVKLINTIAQYCWNKKDSIDIDDIAIAIYKNPLDVYFSYREALDAVSFQFIQGTNHLKNDILSYVLNHYSDNNLTLELLAERFNVSPSYLTRYFKNQTGKSLMQYLDNIRMEQAKKLLLSTELSLDEIISQCGYVDKNNFIQKFKKYYGYPPISYRNLQQQETGGA